MQYKKELCRNFQRGSCQYGERCKFLHVTPQQSNKSNPFGFGGAQSASKQQQKPTNPFGFGVQNSPHSKPSNNIGSKHPQFKPFENKWVRPSNAAPSSRQPVNQPQPTNHWCTDPDSCKRLIADDFESERPLWKLTCYGHWKNAPCDIVGDISYEELRAAAYDDAKHGLSLQSIVEKERNLLNSKLIDFENLLHNPYKGPSNSALASQSQVPGATNAFSVTAQNSGPPLVSSFSQLGASLNSDLNARQSPPSNNVLGQPDSLSNPSQISGPFGASSLPSPDAPNAGLFGSQFANQTFATSFTSNVAGFSNTGVNSVPSNLFSTSAVSTQKPVSSGNQSHMLSNGPILSSTAVAQATTNMQLVEKFQKEAVSGHASVWLKEKWIPGEIPEEAPPDEFVSV